MILNFYICLLCDTMYRADLVERKGKTVCTWDGTSLVPYEGPAKVRAPHLVKGN